MWKIYAPVKGVTGTWASVRFTNGIGETANPALAEWFRQHNYRVEKCDTTTQIPMEKCDEPDFEAIIKFDFVTSLPNLYKNLSKLAESTSE